MRSPAYETANPTRRWDRPLDEFWPALRSRAYRAQGEWWWYILPDGLLVAARICPDFRKMVRLARRDPVDAEAWVSEVQRILGHLIVPGTWYELPVPDEDRGDAAHIAVFLELRSNEHAPGLSRCEDCGTEIPSEPIVRPMRCTDCLRVHRLGAAAEVPDRHAAIIGERDG